MKRVIILISVICAFVSSCQKSPQNILVGSWEVSISVQYEATIGGATSTSTVDGGVWYYTFEENGHGRMVDVNDVTVRYEFTYQYDELFNAILLKRSNSQKETVMEVDVLTKNSFVLHSSDTATLGGIASGKTVATYRGTKIK